MGTKRSKVSLRNAIAIAKLRPRNRKTSEIKLPPIQPGKPQMVVPENTHSPGPSPVPSKQPSVAASRRSSLLSEDLEAGLGHALSRAETYMTESVMSSASDRSRMTSPVGNSPEANNV